MPHPPPTPPPPPPPPLVRAPAALPPGANLRRQLPATGAGRCAQGAPPHACSCSSQPQATSAGPKSSQGQTTDPIYAPLEKERPGGLSGEEGGIAALHRIPCCSAHFSDFRPPRLRFSVHAGELGIKALPRCVGQPSECRNRDQSSANRWPCATSLAKSTKVR